MSHIIIAALYLEDISTLANALDLPKLQQNEANYYAGQKTGSSQGKGFSPIA